MVKEELVVEVVVVACEVGVLGLGVAVFSVVDSVLVMVGVFVVA